MTQELKNKALAVLGRCTVDGNKVRLPEEEIDTEVWTIVKDALVSGAGAQYNKKTKVFIFQSEAEAGLQTATKWLNDQEGITYEAQALYDGPVDVDAEEEPADDEKEKPKQFIKERRTLRYDFTATEIHELAQSLANETRKLSSIEEEKAQVSAQYGATIKEVKATLNKLSLLITNGYDMRDVECEIYYNQPEQGKKTIIRTDTNKADVQRMEPYEYNLFTQPVDEEEMADA